MTLLEKLETRYEAQIVFPDELAREAATEIKRLREALKEIKRIAQHPPYDHAILNIAINALMQSPPVPKGPENENM